MTADIAVMVKWHRQHKSTVAKSHADGCLACQTAWPGDALTFARLAAELAEALSNEMTNEDPYAHNTEYVALLARP